MPRYTVLVLTGLLLAFAGCKSETPAVPESTPSTEPTPPATTQGVVEATSLLGEALLRPELDESFHDEQGQLLAQALNDSAADPADPDAHIWVGRRMAYLGKYRDAIEHYTRGIAKHPEDPRFYRHRGHRYVTVRELDKAIADFERAAELLEGKEPEVEPDGLPNARNQPTGTTHSSVWYHLGLAHYLKGDFDQALSAYRECMKYSGNPDMLVATSHWLYMTLRRLGQEEEAGRVLEPISAGMDVIENHEYHRLLLMYRGEAPAEDLLAGQEGQAGATIGYGVGNWYLYNGDQDRAAEVFRGILEGGSWAAFGYIAAEAEVARPAG